MRAFICLFHAGKGTLREVLSTKTSRGRWVAQEPDKGNWGWREVACAWGGDARVGDFDAAAGVGRRRATALRRAGI